MSTVLVVMTAAALFILHELFFIAQDEEEHPAWPRNVTRDMTLYVLPDANTFIYEPDIVCKTEDKGIQELPLLIVVHSAVKHTDARKHIRDTWGDYTKYVFPNDPNKTNQLKTGHEKTHEEIFHENLDESLNDPHKEHSNAKDNTENNSIDFKVVFVLGVQSDKRIQSVIEDEAKSFGDILQEDFIDTYYNSSIKSTMMLKWLTKRCNDKVAYILKTDDDTNVDVNQLLTTMIKPRIMQEQEERRNLKNAKHNKYEIFGSLECNGDRIDDVKDRLYLPRYIFPHDAYPCYSKGSGYLFTMPVARVLYKAAMRTPLVPYEDLYITGICRENATPHVSLTQHMKVPIITKINDAQDLDIHTL